MSVDIRPVLRKQEQALRQFRQSLFSTDATGSGGTSSLPAEVLRQLQEQGQTVPYRFGPVRSVTDRHAVLTIMGDICDQAVLLERPGQEGSVLTLSIAARHNQLGARQPVDPAEAKAWVEAIVGPSWAPHVYAAGPLSGHAPAGTPASRKNGTHYFYLFLGPDGVPHEAPEHQLGVALSPLGE